MNIDGQQVQALVFDVLGTIVDENGSMTAECQAVVAAAGLESQRGPELAESWKLAIDEIFAPISRGVRPWKSQDDISRQALDVAVRETGIALDQATIDRLALIGHRLQPWPDATAALSALAEHYLVIALSNGNLSLLADLSRNGRLPWHCILSGQLARAYKPAPAVYRLALDLLELDPSTTLMVAAHPWDLRAAALHGMRTAYIARAGEGEPTSEDRFDLYAEDLADLARILLP